MKLRQKFTLGFLQSRIAITAAFSKKKAADLAFDIFCTTTGKRNYEPAGFFKTAEPVDTSFNNLRIRGFQWNAGGSKKILIAHGFSSNAVNFGHFAKKLVAKGYEVFAFDGPAHGRSDGKKTTALEYKNFIQHLMKAYGPFDGFLAHSFGGLAISLALAETDTNDTVKTVFIAPASNTETLLNIYLAQLKVSNKKVRQSFFNKIHELSGQQVNWFSIKRCVNHIKGKILWVHDKGDKVTPVKDAYEIMQLNNPYIEFMFTENLGHRRIYRDDKVVEKVVDFL